MEDDAAIRAPTPDEKFAMLSQQASALTCAVHALLTTVAVPETSERLSVLLASHEAALNASPIGERGLQHFRQMAESLRAAAVLGSQRSTILKQAGRQ
ncbi:hypothetical protein [Arenimonas sp.]|uniref:hypothetical protein n=1 Tax=Arenimonas sp. TaxID=1872635 RepID=UPI0039E4006F